jgi:hypothetical protein
MKLVPLPGLPVLMLRPFDLCDVGDAAAFQVTTCSRLGYMMAMERMSCFFALELALAIEAGHGHIAHDLADDRFTLVGQFDVFHTGAGDFGHRLDPFDILGPDFGHPTAIGVVDAAGPPVPMLMKVVLARTGEANNRRRKSTVLHADAFHIRDLLVSLLDPTDSWS